MFAALVAITGLTTLTAEVPLVLYTFVLLVPNIVAGFDSVPPDVLDAADGMGFSRGQRWRRVELPLAVPLIVAGLRLATVSTIGLVTVSAIIGNSFGGLGYYILDGYNRTFSTEILVGGLLSIALAVAADLGFVFAAASAHALGRGPGLGALGVMDIVNAAAIQWLADPANWQGPNGIPARLEEHVALSAARCCWPRVVALPLGLVHRPLPAGSRG